MPLLLEFDLFCGLVLFFASATAWAGYVIGVRETRRRSPKRERKTNGTFNDPQHRPSE